MEEIVSGWRRREDGGRLYKTLGELVFTADRAAKEQAIGGEIEIAAARPRHPKIAKTPSSIVNLQSIHVTYAENFDTVCPITASDLRTSLYFSYDHAKTAARRQLNSMSSPDIGGQSSRDTELQGVPERLEDDVENVHGIGNATDSVAPLEHTKPVKLKILAAALGFFNAGVNDGSTGALILYVLATYDISTAAMAIAYGVQFFGWAVVAIFGGYLRISFGIGGVLVAAAALQLLGQLLRFW